MEYFTEVPINKEIKNNSTLGSIFEQNYKSNLIL